MLGEGAGVGYLKGQETMPIPEDSTLYDLVQMGINSTHAAVSVVVRLRKELSLVKDVPVLIAIDQVSPPNFLTYDTIFVSSTIVKANASFSLIFYCCLFLVFYLSFSITIGLRLVSLKSP